jgi:hypothetical protein
MSELFNLIVSIPIVYPPVKNNNAPVDDYIQPPAKDNSTIQLMDSVISLIVNPYEPPVKYDIICRKIYY